MTQEEPKVETETVSESPAKEVVQDSSNEQYIAESKKYRRRAQDAESRVAELEKKLQIQKEAELKEKEEYKTLYEEKSSQIEGLQANAEKWAKYEESKKASLIQLHPEGEHEYLKTLNLETLEFVTNKINSVKTNAPEVPGNPRQRTPEKSFSEMTADEKRKNWKNIVEQYKPGN